MDAEKLNECQRRMAQVAMTIPEEDFCVLLDKLRCLVAENTTPPQSKDELWMPLRAHEAAMLLTALEGL